LRIDLVLADVDAVLDSQSLTDYAREIGARLILSKLASDESAELHDPARLSEALRHALEVHALGGVVAAEE